jgi:Zn ribbon nucleic-acid-binding protein
MPCKSCGAANQKKFIGVMGVRSPGLKNIDKLTVWVFPQLIVCLDCGTAEFVVPETELRLLAKRDAATAG